MVVNAHLLLGACNRYILPADFQRVALTPFVDVLIDRN
jgi:hypothetical protein